MKVATRCAVMVEIMSNSFWKQLRGAEELATSQAATGASANRNDHGAVGSVWVALCNRFKRIICNARCLEWRACRVPNRQWRAKRRRCVLW